MRLDQALTVMAEDAGMYANADRALALARRRRSRRMLVGSVAVAMLTVAAIGLPQVWSRHVAHPATPPAVSAGPSTPLPSPRSSYPVVVTPPHNPDTLPTDRGVGPAAFVYAPTPDQALLVTVDGHQYRLSDARLFQAGVDSLSPDGRWLLTGSTVRDLTSTTSRQVPQGRAQWSPQARWLLIDAADGQHLIEAATGNSIRVDKAVAVLDTGDVVVASNIDRTAATITVVDPRTGGERRRFDVNAAKELGPDQGIAAVRAEGTPSLYSFWPARDRAYMEVKGSSDLTVLAVSLTDGHILARSSIPAEPPPYQFWAIAGIDSGRLVLRHQQQESSPQPSTTTSQYQLGLADAAGGQPAIVCRYPARSLVLTRGASTPL
jgi:hypothetical protein